MADLVTHVGVAYFLTRSIPSRRVRILCYLGAGLPDLMFKASVMILRSPVWFAEPFHSVWGALLVSYAASLLFEADLRRTAFAAILLGYLSHIAVDLLKDNLGMGSVLLFFPSMRLWEVGLYAPEASADWIPFWLGAILLLEWLRPSLR